MKDADAPIGREARTMNDDTEIDGAAVGKRLARARKLRGLTQAELAARIGVGSERTIQNYEAGRVPYQSLDKIGSALGRSVDWILYGRDDPSEATRFTGDLPREVRDELANRHDEIMVELRAQSEMLRDLLAMRSATKS